MIQCTVVSSKTMTWLYQEKIRGVASPTPDEWQKYSAKPLPRMSNTTTYKFKVIKVKVKVTYKVKVIDTEANLHFTHIYHV